MSPFAAARRGSHWNLRGTHWNLRPAGCAA